eukprot:jgi/Mesvir1/23663/Mv18323-RA.3
MTTQIISFRASNVSVGSAASRHFVCRARRAAEEPGAKLKSLKPAFSGKSRKPFWLGSSKLAGPPVTGWLSWRASVHRGPFRACQSSNSSVDAPLDPQGSPDLDSGRDTILKQQQTPQRRPHVFQYVVAWWLAYFRVLRLRLKWLKRVSRLRFVSTFRLVFRDRRTLMLAIVTILVVGAAGSVFAGAWRAKTARPPAQMVMYSQFLKHVQEAKVTSAHFESGSERIFYTVADEPGAGAPMATTSAAGKAGASGAGASTSKALRNYVTRRVSDVPIVTDLLSSQGIEFGMVPRRPGQALKTGLFTLLVVWLPLLPMYLFLKQSFRSDSKGRRTQWESGVNFSDVAGVDDAKEELMEIVNILKGSKRYMKIGAEMPRGVLLVGPPGTGKTLLARAVAGEAGVPFFATSASEFVEMFVGRGAARIRELFAQARKRAPAVIFIDELDAVGGQRGVSMNEERDQTLNQLLSEMDGFDKAPGVIVLAATNRPEMLDNALCRPGRISRQVYVGLPDRKGREAILKVHLNKVAVAGDRAAIAAELAFDTEGLAGADLANLVNEAALLAARAGRWVGMLVGVYR